MKNIVRIILAVFAVLLSAVGFSQADDMQILKELSITQDEQQINISEDDLHQSLSEITESIRNSSGNNAIYPKINYDQSKVDAIKGTWIVSYTIKTKSYTDKIVLDTNYTASDGEKYVIGLLYTNQQFPVTNIICGFSPVFNSIGADYFCITADYYKEAYAFRFSGNTITNGYYAVATDTTTLATYIGLKAIPITGYRIDTNPQNTEYRSDYDQIKWPKYQNDTFYCIDIVDQNDNVYPGLRAIKCGENNYDFSPINYVRDVMHLTLPKGLTFWWKVWSKNSRGDFEFHGDKYRGTVVVP